MKKKTWLKDMIGWISRRLLASVTNTTITLIVAGAGFGTIWSFIKKKGV